MKLSEIITKYEPLGWRFEYAQDIDDYWTFKSSRMERRIGFPWEIDFDSSPELVEVNEEDMLQKEIETYIRQQYSIKIDKANEFVKNDILDQLKTLDRLKKDIPDEVKVEFVLKLK